MDASTMRATMLVVHVASGTVAMLASVAAMLLTKGPGAHARVGRAYAVAMLLVALSAVGLWALGSSFFLLLIALFATQLVATGWRLARIRDGNMHGLDVALTIASVTLALGMLGVGVARVATRGGTGPVVLVAFGALSALFAVSDVRRVRGASLRGVERIRAHLRRMLAATIATFTAVLVVNGDRLHLPTIVAWLGPTVLLTPVIALWSRRYRAGPS